MRLGLASASLTTLILLSGCNSLRTVPTPQRPPEQLLLDCPEPGRPVPLTNGLLAQYARDLRDTLRECNADKAGLRSWYGKTDMINK